MVWLERYAAMAEQGTFEPDTLERCRLHLRAALAIFSPAASSGIGLREEAESFRRSDQAQTPDSIIPGLELIGVAAICVGHDGQVLGETAAARLLYHDEFGVVGARLQARGSENRQRLQHVFDGIRRGVATHYGVIRTSRHPDGILVSTVLAAKAGAPQRMAALVLLRDLREFQQPEAALLADAFDLTRAEAETAALIAAGRTVDQIAMARAVSKDTVRTMLKAIFAKTQTARQSQLVLLLSRFTTP